MEINYESFQSDRIDSIVQLSLFQYYLADICKWKYCSKREFLCCSQKTIGKSEQISPIWLRLDTLTRHLYTHWSMKISFCMNDIHLKIQNKRRDLNTQFKNWETMTLGIFRRSLAHTLLASRIKHKAVDPYASHSIQAELGKPGGWLTAPLQMPDCCWCLL